MEESLRHTTFLSCCFKQGAISFNYICDKIDINIIKSFYSCLSNKIVKIQIKLRGKMKIHRGGVEVGVLNTYLEGGTLPRDCITERIKTTQKVIKTMARVPISMSIRRRERED